MNTMTTPTTFDARFVWAANALHHARTCANHWQLACREARQLTAAHTTGERFTHSGRLQTQLTWLAAATGVPVDVLADAVDRAVDR